jgi:naphtho-gamma-pyrone polyketide synthase
MLSFFTGKIVTVSVVTDLLKIMVREALREPVRWDLILASFRSLLAQAQQQICAILPFFSNAVAMVFATLVKDPSIPIVVQEVSSPQAKGKIPPSSPIGRFEHFKIAMIGYSDRFSLFASNEAFWELLRVGRDVHREISSDRFNWKTHFDSTGKKKNISRVKFGCFIDDSGVFDTHFFNMFSREVENTDSAQRLAIMTTYEVMEMAGMVRNRTPGTQ